MVRHRWEERERPARPPAGRFRILLGRGATLCVLFGTLAWIAISLLFHPVQGQGADLGTVQLDPSAATGPAAPEAPAGASAGVVGAAPLPSEEDPQQTDSPGNGSGNGGGAERPTAGEGDPGPRSDAAPPLVVHVAGAVRNPGVYRLPPGTRAEGAVEAAGGLTKQADAGAVNLAAPVSDGQQLYLPEVGEERPAGSGASDGAGAAGGTAPGGGAAGAGGQAVNVNTASTTELESLPGIGPALAERIVDFRERNGPFASLAELDAVSGIGPALLAKLETAVAFR